MSSKRPHTEFVRDIYSNIMRIMESFFFPSSIRDSVESLRLMLYPDWFSITMNTATKVGNINPFPAYNYKFSKEQIDSCLKWCDKERMSLLDICCNQFADKPTQPNHSSFAADILSCIEVNRDLPNICNSIKLIVCYDKISISFFMVEDAEMEKLSPLITLDLEKPHIQSLFLPAPYPPLRNLYGLYTITVNKYLRVNVNELIYKEKTYLKQKKGRDDQYIRDKIMIREYKEGIAGMEAVFMEKTTPEEKLKILKSMIETVKSCTSVLVRPLVPAGPVIKEAGPVIMQGGTIDV